MYDYDVWYKGMIIGNIKAGNDKAAMKLAKKIYGPEVTTERS